MIQKFIKSATYNQQYTERTKRILIILFSSFWIILSILILPKIYEGIIAIPKYNKAKNLLKLKPELEENVRKEKEYKQEVLLGLRKEEFSSRSINFNPQIWDEVGILNPNPFDTEMPETAISLQKDEMTKMYWIMGYPILAFILPWIMLRLFFWIKKADNTIKI